MKKSIERFFSKLQENNPAVLIDGFAILKGVRGGKLPVTNSEGTCHNLYSCSGTNTNTCDNSGKCSDSTNSGTCSNTGTCFF